MKPLKSILVDIDATAAAQPALERAVRIAREAGAMLRIVDVFSAPGQPRRHLDARVDDELMRSRRHHLEKIGDGVRGVNLEVEILPGPPAEALVQDVLRYGHDLVVRSHTRDLIANAKTSFANVDVQLFRHCPCPFWAVGAGAAPDRPRIVAAVDAGVQDPAKRRLNAKVLELARLLAAFQDGTLKVLQAWRPSFEGPVADVSTSDEFSAYLESTIRRVKRDLGSWIESCLTEFEGVPFELRRGDVEDVIPEFAVAEGVDLVVMGTLGRGWIARRLLGSTVERVIRRLPCSVLVVKPDDFVPASSRRRRILSASPG